jgi:hypothetical protein
MAAWQTAAPAPETDQTTTTNGVINYAGQIRVTVAPSLLETGIVAGISVESPTPTVQQSVVAPYFVASAELPEEPGTGPGEDGEMFLPALHR